jgi:hypothetical protein
MREPQNALLRSLLGFLSRNISRKGIHTEISPLRFASVEMTKGRAVLPGRTVAQWKIGSRSFISTLNLPQASRLAGMAKGKVRNEPTALPRNSIPSDELWVPHICPIFADVGYRRSSPQARRGRRIHTRVFTGAPCSHQRTWAENDGRPQISYFALLARATCAALLKKSRMNSINATRLHRKSGGKPTTAFRIGILNELRQLPFELTDSLK